jgi:hypothetical protein
MDSLPDEVVASQTLNGLSAMGFDHAAIRLIPAALWLAIIWTAETYVCRPRSNRIRHGIANLSLAAVNGVLLFFLRRSLERVCLWKIQS